MRNENGSIKNTKTLKAEKSNNYVERNYNTQKSHKWVSFEFSRNDGLI